MNTDQMIRDDFADIEEMRPKIAKEVERDEQHLAVMAGVEAYAKARAQDLSDLADDLGRAGVYVGIADSLRARARAIRNTYGVKP